MVAWHDEHEVFTHISATKSMDPCRHLKRLWKLWYDESYAKLNAPDKYFQGFRDPVFVTTSTDSCVNIAVINPDRGRLAETSPEFIFASIDFSSWDLYSLVIDIIFSLCGFNVWHLNDDTLHSGGSMRTPGKLPCLRPPLMAGRRKKVGHCGFGLSFVKQFTDLSFTSWMWFIS